MTEDKVCELKLKIEDLNEKRIEAYKSADSKEYLRLTRIIATLEARLKQLIFNEEYIINGNQRP